MQYKLRVRRQNGHIQELHSDDCEALKVLAKLNNKMGCDVEIIEEKVLFRIVTKAGDISE